jgi:hypothetical protein
MYSKTAWRGAVDPHILVKFIKEDVQDESDPIASMVIFEWKDFDLIGIPTTADSQQVCWRNHYQGSNADADDRNNTYATM